MYKTNRSHCLQKCTVTCLGIPSDMSTCVRRQATHMLAGLGGMGTPQVQHRLGGGDKSGKMSLRSLTLTNDCFPQISTRKRKKQNKRKVATILMTVYSREKKELHIIHLLTTQNYDKLCDEPFSGP